MYREQSICMYMFFFPSEDCGRSKDSVTHRYTGRAIKCVSRDQLALVPDGLEIQCEA